MSWDIGRVVKDYVVVRFDFLFRFCRVLRVEVGFKFFDDPRKEVVMV